MNKNIATDPIAMIESTRKRERSSAGATLSSDAAEIAAALPDEFVPPDESVDASDDAVVNASACEAGLEFEAPTAAARDAAAAFAVPTVEPAAFVDEVLFAFAAATADPTAEEVDDA